MHGQISPTRACNPCGYTVKMSSRYHRLLIYDVKRTTKIDDMGPFNILLYSDTHTLLDIANLVLWFVPEALNMPKLYKKH